MIADIRRTFKLLLEQNSVYEIRNITTKAVYSGFFDNFNTMALAAEEQSEVVGCPNTYFTLNPVNKEKLQQAPNNTIGKVGVGGVTTKNGDTLKRTLLLIDCDPTRPSGTSSNKEEHEAALDKAKDIRTYLSNNGFPPPLYGDSGNGAHLVYKVDMPNDPASEEVIKTLLKTLSYNFDDEKVSVDKAVYKAAQLSKVYGTMARKGENTDEERPHRRSKIIEAPDCLEVVKEETIRAVVNSGTKQSVQHNQKPPFKDGGFLISTQEKRFGTLTKEAVENLIKERGLKIQTVSETEKGLMFELVECPNGNKHTNGKGGAAVFLTDGILGFKCFHNACEGQTAKDIFPKATTPTEKKATKTISDYVDFPSNLFPETMKTFVEAYAKSMGCDEAYVALPLLTVVAASIGTTTELLLKNSWRVKPIIWTANIGFSGTMKTPPYMAAMATLQEHENALIAQNDEAETKFANEMEEYGRDLAASKSNKGPALVPPPKPKPPKLKRYIVGDCTIESLAPILSDNPRGILMGSDELNGWLGSFGKYNNSKSDAAHWLSMYNGCAITVDRKNGTPKTIRVPMAAAWITGGIQPGILKKAIGEDNRENGLLARLLLAYPPRQTKIWHTNDVEEKVNRDLVVLLGNLHKLEHNISGGFPKPVTVKLNTEANDLWVTFYNNHNKNHTTGDLAAAMSKLEEYAARFALIFHCVRVATKDSTIADETLVDAKSMKNGIELAEWFKYEVDRVYKLLEEDEEESEDRKLVDWIRQKAAKKGETTQREVSRCCWGLREAGAAEVALNNLQKNGFGEWFDTTNESNQKSRVFRLFAKPKKEDHEQEDHEPTNVDAPLPVCVDAPLPVESEQDMMKKKEEQDLLKKEKELEFLIEERTLPNGMRYYLRPNTKNSHWEIGMFRGGVIKWVGTTRPKQDAIDHVQDIYSDWPKKTVEKYQNIG